MTMFTRLKQWKENGVLSPEQHRLVAGLSGGEPLSLFLELNVLLYAGVPALVGRSWLDRHNLVAPTGRCPRPHHPLGPVRRLFLVLLTRPPATAPETTPKREGAA
jgi:hypothetical protein